MKIVKLTQGSPEWHAHRAKHFNASDAPAMMGHGQETRTELLRRLHVGLNKEFSDFVQERVIDPGHQFEAWARQLAEEIVGEELYPVTGVNDSPIYQTGGRCISASFDGINLMETVAFEHKRLNAQLRAAIRQQGGNANDFLPLMYRIQMEQQCMVSGAERVLFMASDWDAEGQLIEERHCWYTPDDDLRAAIVAGWTQFAIDLAAYVPPAATEPPPVGRAPETLPALRIEVTGAVTASNLAEFKSTALAAIRSVNRDLKTDADFADADKAVKWCADVEARLKAAKEHALSQTASIDELFKALDDIAAESKAVRLDLDKLVKRRKDEVREQAVTAVRRALDAHIAGLQAELSPLRLLPVPADFAGSIKGLRSIASMQDALDTTLAAAKIAADGQARTIRGNVAAFKAATGDDRALQALFADLGQLVHKAADDFAAVLDGRIARHRADEAAREARRQAAEAARVAEAERRAAAEAEARVRADQEAFARREREAAEARAMAAADVGVVAAPGQYPAAAVQLAAEPAAVIRHATGAQATPEPATLKLGVICDRLGFAVRADFLADTLQVPHRATDKAAKLYRESDWPLLCQRLIDHISAECKRHAL